MVNSVVKVVVFSLLGLFGLLEPASAQTDKINSNWDSTESRQFDFWIGKWDVNLRMIQKDNSWKDSIKAKTEIYSILDGKAILELWDSPTIKGFSLRHYDQTSKKWILYLNWPSNSNSNVGSLSGEFRHGRGQFFSKSQLPNGNQSMSRYTFCDIGENRLRWDDAYSKDGGKTWTNNWIMEFTRSAEKAHWPTASNDAHTYESGGRCNGPEFDALDSLVGRWKGELKLDTGESVPASLRVYRILDGCSVMRFLEYERNGKHEREFGLLTYNRGVQQFEELRLDNQLGTAADLLRGKMVDKTMSVSVRRSSGGKRSWLRHQWVLPTPETKRLEFTASVSGDQKNWKVISTGTFSQDLEMEMGENEAEDLSAEIANAINATCPRSGKPISGDSLARYRGQIIGFCNTHCRDDFVSNQKDRPKDREFFDKILDERE